MARRIVYQPGSWGVGVPAALVAVEVRAGQRPIWSGVANSWGKIQCPSSGEDLSCLVRDETGTRPYLASVPFTQFENQPIVLPWPPPTSLKGSVGGITCRSFGQLVARSRKFIDDHADVLVDLYFYGVDAREYASVLQDATRAMAKKATGKRPRVGPADALVRMLGEPLQEGGPQAIGIAERLGVRVSPPLRRAACNVPPAGSAITTPSVLHAVLAAEAVVAAIGCMAYGMLAKYTAITVDEWIGPEGQAAVRIGLHQ